MKTVTTVLLAGLILCQAPVLNAGLLSYLQQKVAGVKTKATQVAQKVSQTAQYLKQQAIARLANTKQGIKTGLALGTIQGISLIVYQNLMNGIQTPGQNLGVIATATASLGAIVAIAKFLAPIEDKTSDINTKPSVAKAPEDVKSTDKSVTPAISGKNTKKVRTIDDISQDLENARKKETDLTYSYNKAYENYEKLKADLQIAEDKNNEVPNPLIWQQRKDLFQARTFLNKQEQELVKCQRTITELESALELLQNQQSR